jgi:hypothetical protein
VTTNDHDVQGPDSRQAGAAEAEDATRHPEQEHPPQDAHGGSMAPGLVDDTGHPVENGAPGAAGE